MKLIVVTLVLGTLVLAFSILYMVSRLSGLGREGLFKIGSCLHDDEFGVTYSVMRTFKGETYGQILTSEKYPSQGTYAVGAMRKWSSDENPQKLYAVHCPQM